MAAPRHDWAGPQRLLQQASGMAVSSAPLVLRLRPQCMDLTKEPSPFVPWEPRPPQTHSRPRPDWLGAPQQRHKASESVDGERRPPVLKRSRTEVLGAGAATSASSAAPKPLPALQAQEPSTLERCLLTGCGTVDRFAKLNRIDEGTYGVVFRARDRSSGEVVALKQLKVQSARSEDGFPIFSLREISILTKLNHPNIVNCREVVTGITQDHIFMVMDYAEHELKVLLDRHEFSIAERKCLYKQLFAGVEYLHQRWIMHRDIKTTNILLNNSGILKLCDFGLARYYGDPIRAYTHRVISLWYRPPELLMGQKKYTVAVDNWSAGCVFAEVILRKPIFPGQVELNQLQLIYEVTGTPTEETWPGYDELPNRRKLDFKLALPRWREVFPDDEDVCDQGLELLSKLLDCCPERRLTAGGALEDLYFFEKPLPQDPSMLPTFQESNAVGRRPDRGGPQASAKIGADGGGLARALSSSAAGRRDAIAEERARREQVPLLARSR